MWHRLAGIEHDLGIGVGLGSHQLHNPIGGVDTSQHIGHMLDTHDLDIIVQHVLKGGPIGRTGILVDGNCFQRGTRLLTHNLPRDNVGMVLYLADDDDISLLQSTPRIRVGDKVDRLGGTGREDNFIPTGGIDKIGDGIASPLVLRRGLARKTVGTPMDIGVGLEVVVGQPIEDVRRLLRRGGRIEVDEGLLFVLVGPGRTDAGGQDGKVGADGFGQGSVVQLEGFPPGLVGRICVCCCCIFAGVSRR
mmetsp:Transcript_24405/g.70242  ORF Transcript_24405/g.70242 Transcript_24405/m.70242 type:complete len:248 (+) Transcript_24405:789-1532(+)